MTSSSPRVAVLVPCFNEEAAVAAVVAGFRKALPSAQIYVFDNNSTDRTAAGIVPRLPTAVLATGMMIVAVLSVSSGLVLDTVTRGRREMKLLAYLNQPPP
jgi:hypothetical protein